MPDGGIGLGRGGAETVAISADRVQQARGRVLCRREVDRLRFGKRFLVMLALEDKEGPRPVTVVQNWLAWARR